MKIIFGADHGGFKLKTALVKYAIDIGYKVVDIGTFSSKSVDYPDFAKKVAEEIADDSNNAGVLVCRTGIGMSISANKITGARAALCYSEKIAELSRSHNDANILCLGADFIDLEKAKRIFKKWIDTHFEGGRHKKRVEKIEELERC
ncbi:MAG: ribose 5-phosphate isomerase B [Candidatus Neomarinimicrobiota bacterium]|nr:MAG: ribose 5-phosphate isomerase B [Candidatus Neomarinimicrobiota bacterium]